MKKLLILAATVGLLAVPSVVMAQHSSNSESPSSTSQTQKVAEVEAEHINKPEDKTPKPVQLTQQSTTHTTTTSGVKIEQEGTLPAGSITVAQAQTIAETTHPGSKVTKIEVEIEHGSVIFSVRFADGSKVDVDAKGKVLKEEVEKPESHAIPEKSEKESEHKQ